MEINKSEIDCIKAIDPNVIEDKNIKNKTESNNNNCSSIQKFFSECVGSFFLLYIGSGVGVYTKGDIVPIAFTNGIILCTLIYIFGSISGAHFNPSITMAEFLRKKLTLKELLYYILAQLIGGFLGSLFVALCNRGKFNRLASTQISDYLIKFNDENNEKIDAWSYICALLCEIILTSFLILLYFALTLKNKNNNINPLIVGLGLAMSILTGFHLSGGSMNLVRSLPPAVYEAIFGGNTKAIKQIWIYIIGPLIGVIIGTYTSYYFI